MYVLAVAVVIVVVEVVAVVEVVVVAVLASQEPVVPVDLGPQQNKWQLVKPDLKLDSANMNVYNHYLYEKGFLRVLSIFTIFVEYLRRCDATDVYINLQLRCTQRGERS